MRKILHAADVHLDSPLQKLAGYEDAPIDRIRNASRRAFENLVDTALRESVDLVLIAGDLYDGDWPDQNTGLFFVSQASRLVNAGIPIVVIRGNHDAANVMTSTLRLPANPDGSEIMLDDGRVDLRRFDSIGIAVHGRSFRNRSETSNMAADYPAPISGMCNVGLLHTSLTGAEGHDPYAPCTPAQLTDKNYDYWALGHVHVRGDHGLPEGAPIVFSGNIQGRHIRESGRKGCVIVEVDTQNRCRHRFHELDVVRWQTCVIDATDLSLSDEVIDRFQDWIATALDEVGDRLLVVRVEVTGRTEIHSVLHQDVSQLVASLRSVSVAHGRQQVWLEDVRIRTESSVQSPALSDEFEGPLESLEAVVRDLRSGATVQPIGEELGGLLKRLPPELGRTEYPVRPEDPRWVDELLESATADIFARVANGRRVTCGSSDST